MYSDSNINNQYFGFNDYNLREGFTYKNPNQFNTYNDEIITLNQEIELIGYKENKIKCMNDNCDCEFNKFVDF